MSALALTFDDGPNHTCTPALLDLLGASRATATFFVIGPRATRHPDLVTRMVREGHTVGLHCHEHVRHSSRDADWCRRDTARALDGLALLGVEPDLWRTPWGDLAPFTAEIAAERGLRLVGWDVDTHDWRGDTWADMFAATRPELIPGAVVLAHDGLGPGARREDCAQTLGYVRRVIDYARGQDMRLGGLR